MNKPRSKPRVRSSPRWNRLISLKAFGILFGVTVLMFAIGYVVAVRILFPPLAEPETGILVPSLRGQTVQGAQEMLRELGLRVTEVTEIEHPTEPVGIVTAQSPLPGQQLREMGAVRLAISAGPLPARAPAPEVIPAPEPAAPPVSAPAPDSVVWSVPPPADSAAPPDSVSFFR
jgi:hypothetical protein